MEQERLHLRVFEDSIDILYRPNHHYMMFVKNNDEGKQKVKELALMSRDDFKKVLKLSSMPNFNSHNENQIKSGKLEEWYQGAWKMQTNKLLKELGVENPIEEPLYTEELGERKDEELT